MRRAAAPRLRHWPHDLCQYEAGERNVRVRVLLALKKLYGCPFDAFFAGLDTADDAEA